MKPLLLALFTVTFLGGPIGAYAQKKPKAQVTTKTGSAAETTRVQNQSTPSATPLWQQNILVNIKTGQRTSIEKVMQSKTTAGSMVNGIPAPGGGYYYTPGPANRPATISSSGSSGAVSSSSNASGLGFINQDLIGGGMVLLGGASLFQPLATLGDAKKDDGECTECGLTRTTTSTPPTTDPNIVDVTVIPDDFKSGYEHMLPVFRQLGEMPFETANGNYELGYLGALYDTLMREPFSQLPDLLADEMTGFCPNYPHLNYVQKNALLMLMFSNTLRSSDGKYNPRRQITVPGGSSGGAAPPPVSNSTAYGLCGVRQEFVRSRVEHEYKDVVRRRGVLMQSDSLLRSGMDYQMQDFGVSYSGPEDLMNAENNIRLCVMEMHYNAVIQSQAHQTPKPFTAKQELFADQKTKEKFKNYSLCKVSGGGSGSSGGAGGAAGSGTGGTVSTGG